MSKRIVRYFVSYTRDDERDPERLLKELANYHDFSDRYTLQRWRDDAILPGQNWHAEIQAALDNCDFGLLLVSPAFLGKKYITEHELPHFVSGAKPCIPVALRPLDFKEGDLRGLEQSQFFGLPLPRDLRPRSFQECGSAKHRTGFAHDLFKNVVARLDKLFADVSVPSASGSPSSSIDEAAYLVHIRKHYRHLQLEAFGGDQLTYRDVDLQQVFIPQDARDCRKWLPTTLEGPAELTLNDAAGDLQLAELHKHKLFRDSAPREILGLLDECAFPHRVVLGAPGAGKSSLTRIRLLAWANAPNQHPLPVLVELRRFHRSGHADFLDYLENDPDLVFHFRSADLRPRLTAGSVELIFDGLDEIFEPAARDTAARQIAAYAETFPRARLLVTSRLIGYPGRILRDAAFAHWLLADFDEQKIVTFLDHWLTDAIREPGDRPGLRQRLEDALRSPVIRELAGNPLLLTLMAVLARNSDLPRDQASLYASAADLLLHQWDTHRLLTADVQLGSVLIDQKDKRDLLRDLAWKMQTGQRGLRGNLIGATEVESAMDASFRNRIPDAGLRRKAIALLIDQLTERNYILCHVGGAQFAFVHRAFLEYFASEHIVHIIIEHPSTALDEISEIYLAYSKDAAWQKVLVLAATRLEPSVADMILYPLLDSAKANDVAKAAIGEGPNPFTLVCGVLTCAREPNRFTAIAPKVRASLEIWVGRPEFSDGYGLVRLLAETFPDEATRELLIRLASGDRDTIAQGQAIVSLAAKFQDEATHACLIELARRNDDTGARRKAITVLARYFPNDSTRSLLVELARRDEATQARAQAVESLALEYHDPLTRAFLTELAQGNASVLLRCFAVTLLAERFRDMPETAGELLAFAQSPRGSATVEMAADSLGLKDASAYLRAILEELGGKPPKAERPDL